MALDERWGQAVFDACDPVFRSAGVGFEGHFDLVGDGVSAFLWEAEPQLFVERYLDSGLVESYGEDQWPGVLCVDYWIYVEPDKSRCRVSVEGWNLPPLYVDATGHGDVDGMDLASLLARILSVPGPFTNAPE